MSSQQARWTVAFLVASIIATVLLFSALRSQPATVENRPFLKRDPAKVEGVELELILNKIREGDLRHLKNDVQGARRSWDEARRLGEGLWPIHEGLGDSFLRAKLYDDALREYRTAEPLVPERHAKMRSTISYKTAEVLAESGRPLQALQAYLEANELEPLAARILDQALKAPDRPAAEKALCERAVAVDPRVYSILSAFYAKLDRKAEAAEATARFAMAVAPWEESLNRQAIEELRRVGNYQLAIEVCRAWIRATPEAVQVYRLMGDLLREAGCEKEAIVAYSSIVDIRPGDAQAHRLLGDIFKGIDRLEDAITQYEAARKARPEDAATWATLVSLYEAKGDATNAEETMLAAAKRFGPGGELRSRLVSLYLERLSKLKALGKTDDVRDLRRKLADLQVEEAGLFDVKILMTWDVLSDVDLEVHEPGGERVEHSHMQSKGGGRYYVDNTRGFGPETYTIAKAVPGLYRVGAHLHGNVRSTVKFVVILYEDTPKEERREGTLVLDSGSQPKFIFDVIIPP
jgi:tetratricopeptide (TPR) repeat protein